MLRTIRSIVSYKIMTERSGTIDGRNDLNQSFVHLLIQRTHLRNCKNGDHLRRQMSTVLRACTTILLQWELFRIPKNNVDRHVSITFS
mmetsp:Transcript_11735/g.27485  ORF Transcript_11735/g.27485 Transcript_11735/m.27485 type:complete len:88 (-) Transcript_11735:53-316(-)